MALFEPDRPTAHIPIVGSDQIADVTGAGDTVIATLTLALADVNAVGKFKSASVAAADEAVARITDTDTLSLTRDSGGTAFTKFEGIFLVTLRQKPQARQ
jgi:bifunctional ADP-heptose synthase (sugar kinase/adenylyltransferase)